MNDVNGNKRFGYIRYALLNRTKRLVIHSLTNRDTVLLYQMIVMIRYCSFMRKKSPSLSAYGTHYAVKVLATANHIKI